LKKRIELKSNRNGNRFKFNFSEKSTLESYKAIRWDILLEKRKKIKKEKEKRMKNLEAPIVPDAQIFRKAALESPARPALLSIYEGLTKKGDADPANALVSTTLANVTKTQSRVDHPDGTYDLYALSTFESDTGAVKALEKLKSGLKGVKAWEMQGWVHYITASSGAKVLVIYKSRIASTIRK